MVIGSGGKIVFRMSSARYLSVRILNILKSALVTNMVVSVSFLTSNGEVPDERNEEYDLSTNMNDEKLNRLERAEEKGPNVSAITQAYLLI